MAGRREAQKARTLALIRQRGHHPTVLMRPTLPRQQHPTTVAYDYWKLLQPLVDKTQSVLKKDLYPYLPAIVDENAAEHAREDALREDAARLPELFKKVTKSLADMIEPRRLWWLANEIGQRTSDFNRAQLGASVRAALGIDMSSLEPNVTSRIAGFVTDNVRLISSIPRTYFAEVESGITSAIRSGTRWGTLSDYIEDRYNVATNRAKLIARDQVGKFYGELNKTRQEALGVTGYIWRTMGDEAVRDEHDEREGEHFEWDDPPEDGAPGEPIQCRCYAEPDFSNVVEGLSETP